MAVQLLERPAKICFSKNTARYVFYVNNPTVAGAAVDIRVFKHSIISDAQPPEQVFETRLYPNAQGRVVFYVQDYLRSFLSLNFPEPGSGSVFLPLDQQLYFWIEYRQVTTAVPNNTWVTTERTRKRVMIWGGIEKEIYDRDNFIEYMAGSFKFLSWAPEPRMVALNQRGYITYLRTEAVEAPLFLRWKAVFSNLQEETGEIEIPVEDAEKSFLYDIPVGAQELGLEMMMQENPELVLHYFTVQLEEGGLFGQPSVLKAGPVTYYINYDHSYQYFDWLFINSLGGKDSVRIRGAYSVEVERQAVDSERPDFPETGTPFRNGANTIVAALLNKTYKGDAGQLNRPHDQEWLLELLASALIYEANGDRWLRVSIRNKQSMLAASDDTRWNFPLEWDYAQTNEVHTPRNANIGFGNPDTGETYDPPAGLCPVPTEMQRSIVSVDGGEETWNFSWEGTAPFYILEYRRKQSAVWQVEIIIAATSANLVFPSDGSEYEWRLASNCSNSEFSSIMEGESFTVDGAMGVCLPPTNLTATPNAYPIGAVEYLLSWDSTPANLELEYRKVGAASWTAVAVSGDSTTVTINADGSEYEWRLRGSCGGGDFSAWVYGPHFWAVNTGVCTLPYGLEVVRRGSLTIGGIINESFRFSWQHPGAIKFYIRYRLTGTTTWVNLDSTARNIIANIEWGDPSTYYWPYEWEVAAECSPGNLSPYASGPLFTKLEFTPPAGPGG